MPSYSLITTPAELQAFCQRARQAPYLAVDTEFVRTRTYYARLGLVQLRAAAEVVLVDPVALSAERFPDALQPMWDLLKDPDITLVIHAGGEDYEILTQHMGQIPEHIFDTQIGAAFAGYGDSLGYAALVNEFTGVVIDKSQSRTDWMQRPLAAEQLDYAAADVLYLYDIYPKLLAELDAAGKTHLVMAESAEQVRKRAVTIPDDYLYLYFGNAWQCNAAQLAVLRELLIWRQQRARAADIPLGFVAKDHTMLELARRTPASAQELRGITDLSPVTVRYAGEELLAAITRGQQATALPEPLTRLTDLPDYKITFNAIKQRVQELAAELDVPASLIASRRQINDVIHWCEQVPAAAKAYLPPPDLFVSWRGDKLRTELEALIKRET